MKICNAFSSPQNIVQFKPILFLCLYLLIYSLENTAVGFKVMILCQNFVFCLSKQHLSYFHFMRILKVGKLDLQLVQFDAYSNNEICSMQFSLRLVEVYG